MVVFFLFYWLCGSDGVFRCAAERLGRLDATARGRVD
jgi:hypothetical protein